MFKFIQYNNIFGYNTAQLFTMIFPSKFFIYNGFFLFLLFCPSRCRLLSVFFPIVVVFFIFLHSIIKNIFSSYVLFLSVTLKDNQICFLFKLIQLILMFNHPFLFSI